jgi:hypothetical protein
MVSLMSVWSEPSPLALCQHAQGSYSATVDVCQSMALQPKETQKHLLKMLHHYSQEFASFSEQQSDKLELEALLQVM